jgi:4-amino-4-deoxy-L-arabinose transferase-like glycosyltransferase
MTTTIDPIDAAGAGATADRDRSSRSVAGLVDALWGSWPRRAIVVAVVVGFLLRLWWVAYAARSPVGLNDPWFYFDYARRIGLGGGYRLADGTPTAYYPIGYPAILGAWFRVLQLTPLKDHWVTNAMALNLIFSTTTIAMVGMLGRRLAGAWVGAVSAVIVALFPSLIYHSGTILTETTFNFVFVLALLVLCWRPWSGTVPSWGRLVVFGVLFGVAVEVRPIALLVVPMLLIAFWRVAGRRQALARFAVVVATVVAVMIPWAVRNQVVMHAFLPIGTTTGDNLCIGNNPTAQGHFGFADFCFGDDVDEPRPEFETHRNDKLTSRALRWIVENPLAQLHLIPQRTYYTFKDDHDAVAAVQSYGDNPIIPPVNATALSDLANAYFFAVMTLGLVGVPLLVRGGDQRRLLLLLCMVAVAIAPWPFFGDPRFHVPINVLVPIPAALTLAVVVRQWRPPRPVA